MTLKTIAAVVAKNIGIDPPDTVVSNDPDAVKILEFINETGQELARRVDWSTLRKSQVLSGTGLDADYPLPSDYARFVEGWAVSCDGSPVRGGVTADEWNSLFSIAGAPRYFRLTGKAIGFYPYPTTEHSVSLVYVGNAWVQGGGSEFTQDAQTALIPESLIQMGATWRYKRHISADYSDYMAEYEAALLDLSRADGGMRQP